jgi:hypothetical protein
MIHEEPNGKAVQIAVLQTQMTAVQVDITMIKENHLPHIYARLGKMENKMAYYAGGIVVCGVLADYAIRVIFGK